MDSNDSPTTPAIFTSPDAWSGGDYDLLINLGQPDDRRLTDALTTVWSCHDLDGCYLERDREPSEQPRIAASAPLRDDVPTLLCGVARIGGREAIACTTYVVREPDVDWLYFGLPLGSLARVFPVRAFPFDDGSDLGWRDTVDAWLCAIARSVWAKTEFRYALVGGCSRPCCRTRNCADPTMCRPNAGSVTCSGRSRPCMVSAQPRGAVEGWNEGALTSSTAT